MAPAHLHQLLLLFLLFRFSTSVSELMSNEDEPLFKLRDIVSLLSPPSHCTGDFQSFLGLCLLWNPKLVSWNDAESFCEERGSYLVWLENSEEHAKVRWFVRSKHAFEFWIGLHRNSNGSFLWSSLNPFRYTSVSMVWKKYSFFVSNSMTFRLSGVLANQRFPSLCRLNQSQENPLNLFNLILRIKLQTDDLCPRPWISKEGICLLYFFTQKT